MPKRNTTQDKLQRIRDYEINSWRRKSRDGSNVQLAPPLSAERLRLMAKVLDRVAHPPTPDEIFARVEAIFGPPKNTEGRTPDELAESAVNLYAAFIEYREGKRAGGRPKIWRSKDDLDLWHAVRAQLEAAKVKGERISRHRACEELARARPSKFGRKKFPSVSDLEKRFKAIDRMFSRRAERKDKR